MIMTRACTWTLIALLLLPGLALARAQDEEEEKQPELTEAQRQGELRRAQEKTAELLEGKEDLKGALAAWRELLEADVTNARYLGNFVRLLVELKRFKEALPPAQRLIQLQPADTKARLLLVTVLTSLDRPAEALPHLEWLKQRAPNDAELRKELVSAYEALKRPAEALRQLDWLIAREPANVEYRLTRAELLADLGRDREQLAELSNLLPRVAGAKRGAIHKQLGELYFHEEDFEKAEVELKAAQRLLPGDAHCRDLLRQIDEARKAARRRSAEELREAERFSDWLGDMQDRGEDF